MSTKWPKIRVYTRDVVDINIAVMALPKMEKYSFCVALEAPLLAKYQHGIAVLIFCPHLDISRNRKTKTGDLVCDALK